MAYKVCPLSWSGIYLILWVYRAYRVYQWRGEEVILKERTSFLLIAWGTEREFKKLPWVTGTRSRSIFGCWNCTTSICKANYKSGFSHFKNILQSRPCWTKVCATGRLSKCKKKKMYHLSKAISFNIANSWTAKCHRPKTSNATWLYIYKSLLFLSPERHSLLCHSGFITWERWSASEPHSSHRFFSELNEVENIYVHEYLWIYVGFFKL